MELLVSYFKLSKKSGPNSATFIEDSHSFLGFQLVNCIPNRSTIKNNLFLLCGELQINCMRLQVCPLSLCMCCVWWFKAIFLTQLSSPRGWMRINQFYINTNHIKPFSIIDFFHFIHYIHLCLKTFKTYIKLKLKGTIQRIKKTVDAPAIFKPESLK